MKAPRYMISYTFTASGGRIAGSGYMDDYRPLRDGKPSLLSPEHIRTVPATVAENIPHPDVKVTITNVWRYEEDGEA